MKAVVHVLLTVMAGGAAAACSKPPVALVDGATADGASPDARTLDANPRGTVQVTVYDDQSYNKPRFGVAVVFVDPDGTIVGDVPTNAQGIAQADVLPGASATVVLSRTAQSTQLTTILAIQPGDHLTVGNGESNRNVPHDQFTAHMSHPTATSLAVIGPCGGTSQPSPSPGQDVAITFSSYPECEKPDMELLAIATDDLGNVLGYQDAPHVALTVGGSMTFSGPWKAYDAWTASATNVPAGLQSLGLTLTAPDGYGVGGGTVLSQPAAGSVTLPAFKLPATRTAGVLATITGSSGSQTVFGSLDASSLSYTVDVGAALLPWMSPPSFDAATRTAHVNLDGAVTGDAVLAIVSFQHGGMSYGWTVWGPAATTVVLPPMPTELADTMPTTSDTGLTITTGLFDDTSASGWDVLRPRLAETMFAYDKRRGPGMLRSVSASYSAPTP